MLEDRKMLKVVIEGGPSFDCITRMPHKAIEEELSEENKSYYVHIHALDPADNNVTVKIVRDVVIGYLVMAYAPQQVAAAPMRRLVQ